jgi:hypothetical protein
VAGVLFLEFCLATFRNCLQDAGLILVTRMKLLATAVLAFATGAVAGMTFGGYVLVGWMHRDAAAFNAQDRLCTSVSLRALDDLQTGQVDEAKCFLAQQVGLYYRFGQQLDASSEKQKLLTQIEASSQRSPELKNAITKKNQ